MCTYTAKFKIGCDEETFTSNSLVGLIDRLCESQDLYCLCRHAGMMGDKRDVSTAKKLERFLEKYEVGKLTGKDVRNMRFDFSIGSLECVQLTVSNE